ncbi:MAG: hypothetical protein JWN86_4233 [Planctomycetota bacterium]|nr:hypothetical protein [Planctomycetota bacterium]
MTTVARRNVGRPRKDFDSSVGILILDLLRSGYGRKLACIKAGISYTRFLRHVRADREYAEFVDMAEGSRIDACEHLLFRLVVEPSDTPIKLRAAIAYLARRDRIDAIRRSRREKARKPMAGKSKSG